ncbi:hypothetical protein YPPY06_4767, partial [Yersinia pestis PY-06]
MARRTAARR